jgi:hypothetical protein
VMIELDAAAEAEASIPLELDLKPATTRPPAAPSARAHGSFAPAAVAMALPVGRSVPPPAVDPLEARLAAKFGPAPEHFWQAPAYARRVKHRLRELETEVERRRERAERARREMDDALVSIAVRAIPMVNALPRQQRAAYIATAHDERRALGQWEGSVKGGFKAEEARTDYRSTSADFGHFVVDDTTNFGSEFDAARREIKRLEAAKEGPKKDLAVYEAAVRTYDPAAVQRGAGVLALGAAVVVVAIALTLFLALR